jgi:hypothetical protein
MAAWVAAIPAVMALAQQAMKSQQEGKAGADAMSAQMENLAFQREQARKQYELATAGRTNARGDQMRYVQGQGWVTLPSADTASRISVDNVLNTREAERQLTQGDPMRTRALRRQTAEGDAADPLLMQFSQGFGMPTKAGVKGKNAVANATAATEASDSVQNALSGAALRTGGRMPEMTGKGAPGLRTALAKSDLEGDSMYESMLKAAQGNKLDPYNMLATRAGGEVPKLPESLSGNLDSGLSQAATVAGMRGVGTGAAAGDASKGLAAQFMLNGQQQGPSYDAFGGVLAKILQQYMNKDGGSSGSPTFTDTSFGGRGSVGSYGGTEFG